MSEYIGMVGTKITAEVTLTNSYSYTDTRFSYYGTTKYIYTMQDADGNVYVWKTTCDLSFYDEKSEVGFDWIRKGDTLRITGKVKAHEEYNGTKQTELTRCKFVLLQHGITEEEIKERKKAEQRESLQEGDFIWKMPYRQYKEHYSDCETIIDSYEDYNHQRPATIEVIIRKGRLKNSGVRGKHFLTFIFEDADGGQYPYYAVCEENARRRMFKEYPDSTEWKCVEVI